MRTRVAYLGPDGSHTEMALHAQRLLPSLDLDTIACESIQQAIEVVEADDADLALLPIDGPGAPLPYPTRELLAYDTNLLIRAEIQHPLSLAILAREPMPLDEIFTLALPSELLALCRSALQRLLPNATAVPALSSTGAAAAVADLKRADAALATPLCAARHELTLLREDIFTGEPPTVRYALLGRGVPPRSGADVTSIVCFTERNQPGALSTILQEFATRGLNLTRVESRPSRSHLGDYSFFIDIEGHLEDPLVLEALKGLRFRLREVKFLGSYPTNQLRDALVSRRTSAARAEAERWIDYLSAMIDSEP